MRDMSQQQQQQQQQQRPKPGDVFPVSGDQVARAEREELVGRRDVDGGRLSVVETDDIPGKRVITAAAGGQVMAQFAVPAPAPASEEADILSGGAVTIGEALEAAASGDPVGQSDAAAIQAAEARATGLGITVPGGIAARAQEAAESNTRVGSDEEKVKLRDVLDDATAKLPTDKVATREDAERVKEAERRNNPSEEEAGVSMAMEAASRMNKPGVV